MLYIHVARTKPINIREYTTKSILNISTMAHPLDTPYIQHHCYQLAVKSQQRAICLANDAWSLASWATLEMYKISVIYAFVYNLCKIFNDL